MPPLHKFQSWMAREQRAANAYRIKIFRQNLRQKTSNAIIKLAVIFKKRQILFNTALRILASTDDITELRNLYLRCDNIGKKFRVNIRAYNSAFAFTSMGVKLDKKLANDKDGVYTFRAQGGIYHLIGSLLPIDRIPKFLQLYIYDTKFEMANRLYVMPQFRQDILEFIKLMLNQLNPFIINFCSISSYMNIAELRLLIRADHGLDQRVYNKLTASQISAVWVEGGRLFQQYVIDNYVKIECARLNYL
ncbi:7874_t:CDS:2 [Dentiscutata heterogama]|uniref:7874_t:CDS:1 n=1 Tax=Dentiscutata heterogama TaxID=1316150 RepID=A0ACA9JZF7_9GLOM|nr:7874_t:CDS:2 [Dentiscutata heterogama]